jgi:hypothetical protein
MHRIKPLTIAAFGARGTGKTAWVRQLLRKLAPARLMVWDFKHDADLAGVGKGFTSWPAFVKECTRNTFAARYLPSNDHDMTEQFDAFCRLAWREGNLTMMVDELPEVTKANRAPPAWRKCVNVGRSYDNGTKALAIIGAGQRPTEVDKSFLGNCDVIHTGRLGFANDAKLFASMWGIPYADLSNLPDLHWVEKRADQAEIVRGVLSFSDEPSKKTARKKQA